MNIFCINLDRAVERKQAMVQGWVNGLGLDIKFWPAYDRLIIDKYQKMIYQYDPILTKKRIRRFLNNGEIACATSFYQLFEFILQQNIDECIIMEDDIIPLIDSKDTIFNNIKKSKEEFTTMEVLLMHKISPTQSANNNPVKGATYSEIFHEKKECSSLCKKVPWGNQCFYITRKAVELAYQNLCKDTGTVNIWYPADYFGMPLCLLKHVCILNNPVCDHNWTDQSFVTYIGNEYRGSSPPIYF